MQLTRLQELTSNRADESFITEGSKKQEADFSGIRNVVEDALADLHDKIGKGGNLAKLFKESGASKLDTYKDEDGKNVLAQILAKVADFKKSIDGLMTEAEILVNQASMSEDVEMDDAILAEAKKELTPAEKKTLGWFIIDSDGHDASYRNSAAGERKANVDCKEANKGLTRGKCRVIYGYLKDGHGDVKKLPSPVYESLIQEAKEYSDSSDFTDEFYGIVGQVTKIKQAMKNPRWMKWMKSTDDNYGTDAQTPARSAITAVNSLDTQLSDIDDEFDKAM